MFNSRLIYIKLKKDWVEVTDLDRDKTISKQALQPFSSIRNVIGSFDNANATIALALNELGIGRTFLQSKLKVLIQQLEGIEGGLNDLERRALIDLAEMTGAKKIVLLEHIERLSIEDALTRLKEI
jgi:hypothetical protein